jgi:hypothetical protein
MKTSTVLPLVSALLAASLALPAQAAPLRPFEAHYEVWLDGKRRGESTMQLVALPDGRWEHRVDAAGTSGLAGLAGAGARQSSHFELVDGLPRLIEASSDAEAVMRRRRVRTVFDWSAGTARWEGDVKPDQTGPVALEPGASNGALVNLQLAMKLDQVQPGAELTLPLFERGRVTRNVYRLGVAEAVRTPAGEFSALPFVTERRDRQRVTTLWYVPNMPPTPVRMLQTEGGKPKVELRLVRVTPAS